MRFKIFNLVLLVLIVTSFFVSCQSVKDFYLNNRELIQDIIKIVLDTIFENISIPTTFAPSGDNSGMKVQSSIPTPENQVSMIYYKEQLSKVINSEIFWQTVNGKVDALLKERGVR